MLKYFLLLILSVSFYNCKKANTTATHISITDSVNYTAPDTTIVYKNYLALGDSYTIGQSVTASENFPAQTVQLLNQLNKKFTQPEIIAQTGWTTTNLLNKINNTPPLKPTYDIVTLLIGVNNQYQGLSIQQYSNEFTILLNKAIQLANNKPQHVVVLSIPDYSVTPFVNAANKAYVANQIDSFNAVNASIAQQVNVQYLNITPSTRLAANNTSLLAPDMLHPSAIEYKKWADSLQRKISAVL